MCISNVTYVTELALLTDFVRCTARYGSTITEDAPQDAATSCGTVAVAEAPAQQIARLHTRDNKPNDNDDLHWSQQRRRSRHSALPRRSHATIAHNARIRRFLLPRRLPRRHLNTYCAVVLLTLLLTALRANIAIADNQDIPQEGEGVIVNKWEGRRHQARAVSTISFFFRRRADFLDLEP